MATQAGQDRVRRIEDQESQYRIYTYSQRAFGDRGQGINPYCLYQSLIAIDALKTADAYYCAVSIDTGGRRPRDEGALGNHDEDYTEAILAYMAIIFNRLDNKNSSLFVLSKLSGLQKNYRGCLKNMIRCGAAQASI